MQNYWVDQWTKSIEISTALLKQFSEANAVGMRQFTDDMSTMKDFAKLSKSMMDFYIQWGKISEYVLNTLIQSQLATVNAKAFANATREYGEILTDATKRLTDNQMAFLSIYMEASASYLEGLKDSKTTNDLAAVGMHTLTDIQEKSKESFVQGMEVLKGIETAMVTWTERTVDAMAAQSSDGSSAPSVDGSTAFRLN
jgi:hypothetical protein